MHTPASTIRTAPAFATSTPPGLGLLLQLKLTILRNRVSQLINQSPLRLLLVLLFIGCIWFALYAAFDNAFVFMRRFEQEAALAIPYVFQVFFVAMTCLLSFSTAVLSYGSLFGRAEPSFLMATPNRPLSIVAIMYLEALFFASWSLLLLGLPLMLALGQSQGLPWHFYVTFIIAFLGFVPIPGSFGLLVAFVVARWLPRLAKRTFLCASGVILTLIVVWWARLWAVSSHQSTDWLNEFLNEFQYLKAAMLPPTWVANAIRFSIEGQAGQAAFYLAVTVVTALFLSWVAVNIVASGLPTAFGRAHTAPGKNRAYSGWVSKWITEIAFCYLPRQMRLLILKDVRTFLRDPMQWAQLVILFGLLSLYLAYLPRSQPDGFDYRWKALICFLNFGAVTLILSTFTSRFVFPMMSLEGNQMWLVGLWPLTRARVVWAKFIYSLTITAFAAATVTILSIRSLDLPLSLSLIQGICTFTTCAGLCGLAAGLGARLPSYREAHSGRIASGLGGTINLIASVALVAINVGLFGMICFRMVRAEDIIHLDWIGAGILAGTGAIGLLTASTAMGAGIRAFGRQEF